MPLREVRGYQSKRGQSAKGRRGGRPRAKRAGYKKERQEEMLPQVRFYAWLELTPRQIERKTGVPYVRVWRWLNKHGRA